MNSKMNNNKMEYYMGFHKGTYNEVLDGLEQTEVYSFETSSIPLAEFWQPANLARIEAILSPHLPGIDLAHDFKFFEFPTDPVLRGVVCSDHPSMTDLMIMHPNDWQIAIEAKYTEYVRMATLTCGEWITTKRKNRVRLMPYRHILRAWVEMISNAKCTDLSMIEFYKTCMDVGYQFLHRTASACFKTNGPEESTPVLVYQLFYKQGDAMHIAKMKAFKNDLRRWAKLLRLKNMKFLIVSVPIVNADEVKTSFEHLLGNRARSLFTAMRESPVYRFDFENISIETVVDKEIR